MTTTMMTTMMMKVMMTMMMTTTMTTMTTRTRMVMMTIKIKNWDDNDSDEYDENITN